MKLTAPRGTQDILPEKSRKWQYLEQTARDLSEQYGFQELRFPVFEQTELFLRSVGETSDIVNKEMYTFKDKSERSLTLRPEGTAPAVRAYIQHKLFSQEKITKLYYTGPMFRYDRPQSGRYRQFHQYGVELFGTSEPLADVEVIYLSLEFLKTLGLSRVKLELNSVGCPVCREQYKDKLISYLEGRVQDLCTDCRSRYNKNPLRVLDCKKESCKKAVEGNVPVITDNLCDNCAGHFDEVKELLELLKIDYHINPRMVRGLDYYTKTAFELVVDDLGAQNSVGGGGRYDRLVQELGGPDIPAVGFAIGLERVLLALEKQGVEMPEQDSNLIFLVTLGEKGREAGIELLYKLRKAGFMVNMEYESKSLRGQLKKADKEQARYSLIIGEEELQNNMVVLKDMKEGSQKNIPLTDIDERLIEIIK